MALTAPITFVVFMALLLTLGPPARRASAASRQHKVWEETKRRLASMKWKTGVRIDDVCVEAWDEELRRMVRRAQFIVEEGLAYKNAVTGQDEEPELSTKDIE